MAICLAYQLLFVNYSYMLNISPKFFENGSPSHHTLILTLSYGIYYIFLSENTFILIAKENTLELLKAFHYREKFLHNRSVVLFLA